MTDKIKEFPERNKRQDKGKMFLVPSSGSCSHLNGPFVINKDSGTCTCKSCGESVSPIFVLTRLMKQESRWSANRKYYMDEMERLSKRSSTKCGHCGKMTKISRK